MGETIKEQHIWIGVDVGTTGVRAIAYEASGVSRASAEAFYPLRTPHPDWAEERPAEIRAATARQQGAGARRPGQCRGAAGTLCLPSLTVVTSGAYREKSESNDFVSLETPASLGAP
mgnify:CR=1 FL=1